MKSISKSILLIILVMSLSACSSTENETKEGTFGYDVEFLEEHTDVFVLESNDGQGKVLVTPEMQGRVMTSTIEGDAGKSLGWVNRELIASGEIKDHFTPYGGEDRFWIGPEGGQFSVFLKPGKEMIFENWFVPSGINTELWKLSEQSEKKVTVTKDLNLKNYSNTEYQIGVKRAINLLDEGSTENLLDLEVPEGVRQVAYETKNTIRNTGQNSWTKETGAPAIWILSMFTPAPGITVAIPFKEGSEEEMGAVVTTEYFGDISPDRLKVEDGIIYFKVDGKQRRKLGVPPRRSLPVAGSYDETNEILTLIHYSRPANNTDYVNQLWKQQENPYNGSSVFAYNDGPLKDGTQLGPFYELESSSPAAFLKPDETLTHYHRVFHFTGDRETLNQISKRVLGVNINDITAVF